VLITRNLRRRPLRTALSVLGVAIGIAAIVAFHAVGRGFRASIDRYLSDSGAQMLVVNKTVKDPAFSRVKKDEQDFIREHPEVEHLSRANLTLASPRGLPGSPRITALVVFGRQPGDRLLDKYRKGLRGRLLEKPGEMLLGSIAAEDLKLDVGGTLELFSRKFEIVGVYTTAVPWERVGAIVANEVVEDVLRITDGAIYMGFVYLRPGASGQALKEAVAAKFPHLEVMKTEEFTMFYDQLEYIDWFVWIVSIVSVAVGGLGVLNTLLMSVSERTREIGTLRAVGWSRARVLRMILGEGALVSVLGGLAGLVMGVVGAETLIRWAPRGFLGTQYAPLLFAEAMAVALGLGFVGALYPAWKASRLRPIEALRYE
jgi:putative ABC transport system permease protein